MKRFIFKVTRKSSMNGDRSKFRTYVEKDYRGALRSALYHETVNNKTLWTDLHIEFVGFEGGDDELDS